ncbi:MULTISPECIES: hypothetical protein [Anaerostipes]|uniref:hypothetical protein n=1 Tax=Anaerostipes TaxID=207244 RepID=UPI000952BC8C|nr:MULTISPECIES: hypothetical protein [Anaerostipes]OLR58700.1 hypothetical protein BHF70_03075 [Anaerostipes sp. 494a]
MSEIFVEEENTVYEMDEECLRKKHQEIERQKKSRNSNCKCQSIEKSSWLVLLIIILCFR